MGEIIRERIFKNGTKHMERIDEETGKHLGFVKHVSDEDFIMPTGRHIGKTMREIMKIDRTYIPWVAKNYSKNNIKKRAIEFLKNNG